jgi:hypothetical protein
MMIVGLDKRCWWVEMRIWSPFNGISSIFFHFDPTDIHVCPIQKARWKLYTLGGGVVDPPSVPPATNTTSLLFNEKGAILYLPVDGQLSQVLFNDSSKNQILSIDDTTLATS